MSSTVRKRLPLVALALVVAMSILAVILFSRSSDATPEPIDPSASGFSVLEPATPAAMNAVSEQARMRMDFMASHPDLPTAGSAPEGGVRVSEVGVVERADGADVTVAAIGGAICAFLENGVGGCDLRRRVAAGQSFSVEPFGCDRFRVLGVVPDGVTNVAIDSEEDGEVDIALLVKSNVYVGVVDPIETVVTGLDESGNALFEVQLPLGYYGSTQRIESPLSC